MDLKIALLGFLAILANSLPLGRKSEKLTGLELGCYKLIPNQTAKGTRNYVNIWPLATVPFELATPANWNLTEISIILQGMKLISEKTCIRFRPRNARDASYVSFVDDPKEGCSSLVGRAPHIQPQKISLSRAGYCVEPYIVAHEVMHALGFDHEHARPDRDDYIEILWKNIQENKYPWFFKMPSMEVYHRIRYDFDSIMHYEAYGFSVRNDKGERQPTMKSRVPYAKVPETPNKDLSISDVLKLHELYRDHCYP